MMAHMDLARRVLLAAIIGALTITDLLQANHNVRCRLAHSSRKRKTRIQYPVRTLS